MKKNFTFFIVFLLFMSCDSNSYTINGTVADEKINGLEIYMFDYDTRKNIDTAVVKDGVFTFTGSFKSPALLRIGDSKRNYYANLLAENANITVELKKGSVVSSKGINGELTKMEQQLEGKDNPSRKALMQSVLELNKDNSLGIYCIYELMVYETISLMQIDSLLNKVPIARKSNRIMGIYNKYKSMERIGKGSKFFDSQCENVDGTPAKLSDYVGKGKYVLVNFGASWCTPCTAENPNFKYLHENYPDLVVLGVNVLDKKENFHKYVKDHDIKWPMLHAGVDNTAADIFGVFGVPTIILFDPQGSIVDRALRGEVMKKKIAEIFKK